MSLSKSLVSAFNGRIIFANFIENEFKVRLFGVSRNLTDVKSNKRHVHLRAVIDSFIDFLFIKRIMVLKF